MNCHRVKLYYDKEQINKNSILEILPESEYEAITFMIPFPNAYKEMMPWVHETGFIYDALPRAWERVKLEDIDETREGIVVGNVVNVPRNSKNKKSKITPT